MQNTLLNSQRSCHHFFFFYKAEGQLNDPSKDVIPKYLDKCAYVHSFNKYSWKSFDVLGTILEEK